MPSTSNRQASIDSRRIALEREITIRVARFDSFVTEYSTNISTTGMFIVSEKPYAPGTTFSFEFSVADDWKLIRGKAQVVWTRYRDEDNDRPAGMGVRFVELDAQSRRLIRWIVEKHIREGGRPFELDELRNVIDEALGDVIESEEAAAGEALMAPAPKRTASERPRARRPTAQRARPTERKVFPLLVTAGAIVLGLLFLVWLTEWIPLMRSDSADPAVAVREPISSGAEAAVPSSASGAEGAGTVQSGAQASGATGAQQGEADLAAAARVAPAANAQGEAAQRGPSSPPLGSAYTGVRDTLTEWSDAWSAQEVDRYLAAYSRNFTPEGSSRSAWEALRRDRLAAPGFINVSISQLDIVRIQDDLVEASFFQSYRSDRFSDSVQKVMELTWEGGRWKILSEAAR